MEQQATALSEQPLGQPQAPPTAKPRRTKAVLAAASVFVLTAVGVVGFWFHNQATLQKPLYEVLEADSRNKNVHAQAHYDGWFDTKTVVFNLSDVSGESSSLDIFRVFLQFAQSQKEHEYKEVILAAYGEKKFVVPGDYFHELGAEYSTQNPMYTIRTFPHHVSTMTGEHPFPEYTGGIFGVLGKEMDEFKQMNEQWYMDDYKAKDK